MHSGRLLLLLAGLGAPKAAFAQAQPQPQSQAPAASEVVAQATTPQPQTAAEPAPMPQTYVGDYFANWFDRVEAAQASQPHWMTPLVTVTPRLEQEVRYDQYWESRGNGSTLDIFDAGKGV